MADECATVSAPGRVILFGEHICEFGALALAVELRATCTARISSRFCVKDEDLDPRKHPLERAAILHGWADMDTPVSLAVECAVPKWLGSEAASMVACMGAMSMIHNLMIYEHVARNAFMALQEITPGVCPIDISASTHGRGVFAARDGGTGDLWDLQTATGGEAWRISAVPAPGIQIVIGIPPDGEEPGISDRVARFKRRNRFAMEIVRDMAQVLKEAREAMMAEDLPALGDLMNRYQRLLVNLGASRRSLDKLISSAAKHSYGAKVMGENASAVLILPRDIGGAVRAIEAAGGKPLVLSIAARGVRPED